MEYEVKFCADGLDLGWVLTENGEILMKPKRSLTELKNSYGFLYSELPDWDECFDILKKYQVILNYIDNLRYDY